MPADGGRYGHNSGATLFDPDAIFQELERAAEAKAEAQEQADLLEELKNARLAELVLDYWQSGDKSRTSRTDAEWKAKGSPEWRQFLEGLVAAKRKANRANARYKNVLVLAEMRRTQESTNRALTTGR